MEDLVRKRAGHRSSATKLQAKANEYLNATGELDLEALSAVKIKLQEKCDTLKNLENDILSFLTTESEIAEAIEAADERDFELRITIQKIISRELSAQKAQNGPQISRAETSSVKTKLPAIQIKRFHGDPKLFNNFYQQFVATVDSQNIEGVTKFTYLKSLVGGEAERAISGLAVTSENYAHALEILQKRFGNPQLVINTLMADFVRIEGVKNMVDTQGLRRLCDTVESGLRGLESVGVSNETYGCLLVPILMDKLPSEMRLIINRALGSNEERISIRNLLDNLEGELAAREKSSSGLQAREEKRRFEKHRDGGKSGPGTTDALLSNREKIKCHLCTGNHFSDKCDVYSDIDERKSKISELGLCFICLKPKHKAQDCKSGRNCFYCKKPHHSAICPKTVSQHENEENSLVSENSSESTLMQTATAQVTSPNGKAARCRMLFDSASQRTYVRARIAKRLNLPVKRSETLSINSFGEQSTKPIRHEICDLNIQKGKTNVLIEGTIVENLCLPVKGQGIPADVLSAFSGIELADDQPCRDTKEIDILVGLDSYYKFISAGVENHESGLTIVESNLGKYSQAR